MDNLIQVIPVFNEDELYELNKFVDENLSFTRSTTFNGPETKIDPLTRRRSPVHPKRRSTRSPPRPA